MIEEQLTLAPQTKAPTETASNDPVILSVSDLNSGIRSALEGQYGLVWIRGEISNFKAHTSGHHYFSLKDSKSQVSAVMFRGYNSRLKFKPTDGLEVVVRGRITVYEPRGSYQIACELMEPVGAGALQKAFEQLKEKLRLEGLFDQTRKKPIPHLPRHVAIVTSPTGAAIRDMLNVLSRRSRGVNITLVPTIVQGASAAPQICEALTKAMNLPDVDAIIIGRGGGSIEDMWCFNDERLARLIASSQIPIISAVGHEIDFTIADFVADLRAPTPSAAAELVVKNAEDLLHRIQNFQRMLKISIDRLLKTEWQKVNGLSKRLVDPKRKLQDLAQKNDDLVSRLSLAMANHLQQLKHDVLLLRERLGQPDSVIQSKRADLKLLDHQLKSEMQNYLESQQSNLSQTMAVLDSLSPLKVVERGYSLVTKNKELVKSSKQLKKNDEIQIQFAEGQALAQVISTAAQGG